MADGMWVNENDLERCVCTAILWKDDIVLDMMEFTNEAQLAPFLRDALGKGATRFESIADDGVTVRTIVGKDILVECTKAEMVLAYHMVTKKLSEPEVLAWLEKRD